MIYTPQKIKIFSVVDRFEVFSYHKIPVVILVGGIECTAAGCGSLCFKTFFCVSLGLVENSEDIGLYSCALRFDTICR